MRSWASHVEAVREVSVWAVLDSDEIPRWQRTLVEDLDRLPDCRITAWGGAPSGEEPSSGPSRLFRMYERWDRGLFASGKDALAAVDPPVLADERGSADPPDLVLWLTERPLPERSPEGVRHGIWFIRQGAARVDREAPLFAELKGGDGVAVTSLCALVGDEEHVLASSTGPCDRVSLHRSRARAYARAAVLPFRVIGRIRPAAALALEPQTSTAKAPSAFSTAGLVIRIAARLLRRRAQALLFQPRWIVAYRRMEGDEGAMSFARRYPTLLPPPGRAFADPFPVEDTSGDAMLFEDYEPDGEPGKILAVGLDREHGAGEAELVLSRETHLSYPFLIREEGQLYMVPESRQAREVELLRSTDFPLGWDHDRMLIRGLPATDSTLFRHEGRLWLFAALSPDGDAAVDELHLFSAPSLEAAWTPHPANPVVADVRSARPAGALLHHNGQLLRPAQDCSRAYGWRVVLNRVEMLTESDYRETPVGQIDPAKWSIRRVHTYNRSEHWEALDAQWMAPRLFPRAGPKTVRFRLTRYPGWNGG